MTTWAERAKAHFLRNPQVGPDKTDETPLLYEREGKTGPDETDKTPLSSVLSGGGGDLFKKRMFLDGAANDHERPAADYDSPKFLGHLEPPVDVQARLRAKALALDAEQAGIPAADPDSYCWPHSTAMNTAEIDTFTARMALFTGRRVILDETERLADLLVIRDREQDDRRLCLECSSCQHGRCTRWLSAGLKQAQLPAGLATTLQRCGGFTPWV